LDITVDAAATPAWDYPEEEDTVKNRLLIEVIAVVVAFSVGFLPQYIKTRTPGG
jgi:hypothetical protein